MFVGVHGHVLVTMDHLCSAAMSHHIMQPCALAMFSFKARCGLGFAALALGSFEPWSITVFYGRLLFGERSVSILIAPN